MEPEFLEPDSMGDLLASYRPRLQRMVGLRLDPRLRRRMDSSDVLQEAFTDVARRVDEYRADPRIPFFLWVRRMTAQKLAEMHRRHFDAEKRDVRRETRGTGSDAATSVSLARAFVDSGASPSELAGKEDEEARLRLALEELEPIDREILMLRYFEQLSTKECAQVLELTLSATKMRHLRAIERLQRALVGHGLSLPGTLGDAGGT